MTPWTIQSIEFSRPEYWSGSPFPSPGDLPNPGIEPRPPALQVDSLPAEPQGKPKNTGGGYPIPSPADFPDLGIEPGSSALQVDFFTNLAMKEAHRRVYSTKKEPLFSLVQFSCSVVSDSL